MANRKQRVGRCSRCKRPRDEGELFSARGRCEQCGDNRPLQNMRELQAHSGPYFDHWRARTLAAFGISTPDPFSGD